MKKVYVSLGVILLLFFGVGTFFDLNIAEMVFIKDNSFSYVFEHLAPIVYGSIIMLGAAFILFTQQLKQVTKLNVILSSFFYVFFSALGLMLCFVYGKILGLIYGVIALCVFAYITKKMPEEIKPSLRQTGIMMVIVAFSTLIVEAVKPVVGRVRFRSMQENFDLFTRWYQVNGDKYLHMVPAKEEIKSFPSGHSYWAGTTLVLSLIPLANPKWYHLEKKVFIASLVYAFIVMLSRMMQGAHFLTDVTVGFSTAFVAYLIVHSVLKKKLVSLK